MGNEFFLSVDRQVTAVVVVTALVLIINQLVRLRIASLMHKTIRAAVTANSPLAPALIEKLDQKPTLESDGRTGLILLAVAGALTVFGLIEAGRAVVAVAVFPAAIGAILLWRARSRRGADPSN